MPKYQVNARGKKGGTNTSYEFQAGSYAEAKETFQGLYPNHVTTGAFRPVNEGPRSNVASMHPRQVEARNRPSDRKIYTAGSGYVSPSSSSGGASYSYSGGSTKISGGTLLVIGGFVALCAAVSGVTYVIDGVKAGLGITGVQTILQEKPEYAPAAPAVNEEYRARQAEKRELEEFNLQVEEQRRQYEADLARSSQGYSVIDTQPEPVERPKPQVSRVFSPSVEEQRAYKASTN